MKLQHLKEMMVSNIRAKGQELVDDMQSFMHELFVTCPQISEYEPEELSRVLKCMEQIVISNVSMMPSIPHAHTAFMI